ncbi:hypothetical protein N0V93_001249 [Gnomoniopsis smithogilvyi]|uniref:Uncharacterized protein n=1 Tax=Gnomoniopsis smithogilvyi TaxID=1191159 RepID=A0A9W9D2F8_9PEZI|nr:hypothetical protein N0V93_001249 [Gnomoniopsis smithogilvyi]
MPTFAPVESPGPGPIGIDVPVAAAASDDVVAAAALVAAATLVELVVVLLVLAALAVVVVRNICACVAFPNMAATKSPCGQPAVLAHALLEQHPIKGVLSAEHSEEDDSLN